jgi:CheY-like chemotaxis protein
VEHEPALVLLDLQLPRMTGIELLARKATTPSIAATPVIVITGITPVPKVENVVAILQKPFTSDELLSLVRTFAPMPEPEAA